MTHSLTSIMALLLKHIRLARCPRQGSGVTGYTVFKAQNAD